MNLNLPEKNSDLAYSSLSRYVGKLNLEEKKFLKNLPVQKTKKVFLSKALLALNDKLTRPQNTKIIKKLTLSK